MYISLLQVYKGCVKYKSMCKGYQSKRAEMRKIWNQLATFLWAR